MATSLNLERRVLEIGAALMDAGMEAHVRALDFKGGQWLALRVRRGESALELRYRKRLPSAKILVAGTDADIAERVRGVHVALVRKRGKVLENGYRHLLNRTVRLLERFEASLKNNKDNLAQALEFIQQEKLEAPCRPAVVLRGVDGRENRFESFPAVAIEVGSSVDLAALVDGQPIDLSELMRNRREEKQDVKPPGSRNWAAVEAVSELADLGVELIAGLVTAVNPSSLIGGGSSTAADAAKAGGEGVAETVAAGAAEVTAETGQQAFDVLAEAGGNAAEVVTETGSCLGDAACGGLDCGGVDCGGLDCIPF